MEIIIVPVDVKKKLIHLKVSGTYEALHKYWYYLTVQTEILGVKKREGTTL